MKHWFLNETIILGEDVFPGYQHGTVTDRNPAPKGATIVKNAGQLQKLIVETDREIEAAFPQKQKK